LLAFTLIGGVITLHLPLALGFGQMGVEHTTLPFRLDAVITRFRVLFVPASFVLLVWRR
jgi:hypothetical protein